MAERAAADELEAAKARIAELEALDAERRVRWTCRPPSTASRTPPAAPRTSPASTGRSTRSSARSCAPTTSTSRSTTRRVGLINFPYYVDTVDTDIPDPGAWEPFGVGNARGSTAYVLRTGRPALITPQLHKVLAAKGELEHVGVVGEGDWLGVPLSAEGRTLGVLAVQGYTATETTPRRTSTCSSSSGGTWASR